MIDALKYYGPLEIFETIITPEIYDHIIKESVRYSATNLSVDEMIIKYYGHNSLKKFVKGKPIRFDHKFWALCGVSVYCYNFELYCGKNEDESQYDDLTLGSRVVLQMLEVVEDLLSHCVYFHSLFTSYDLLVHLLGKGFEETGTMRENRLKICPLKDSQLMKKENRGCYDNTVDVTNEILIVKCLDNKCVSNSTHFDAIEPTSNVLR
eukprot:XP_014768027.1 PREDICTED: piggyBac transposable element-derived protein 3-like [Octopus bimaculoides]